MPFTSPDGGTDAAAFGAPQAVLTDRGRLRAVLVDPATPPGADGSAVLYVLTGSTDGRGTRATGRPAPARHGDADEVSTGTARRPAARSARRPGSTS